METKEIAMLNYILNHENPLIPIGYAIAWAVGAAVLVYATWSGLMALVPHVGV